jgi:hypothetical protein
MDEVEIFFATFQILGPLGCQGWVVISQNVKKVKITAPYSACSIKSFIRLALCQVVFTDVQIAIQQRVAVLPMLG